MIKVKALVDFTYGKFDKIQNYVPAGNNDGMIHAGDVFEVDQLEANYLCGDNSQNLKACEVLEVIEEVKKTTRKRK